MPDKHINLWVNLKDNATKQLSTFTAKTKSALKDLKSNYMNYSMAARDAWMAVNKVVDAAEYTAKYDAMRQALNNLSTQHSVTADKMISDLREVSRGTVSNLDLLEQSSKALLLGLRPEELITFMEAARSTGLAMGQDINYMFESITTGVARQSKLWLDNLGIIIDTEKAYQDYAKSIGKTTKELTDLERRQAFTNAALEAAREKIKAVGMEATTQAEKIAKMRADMENLRITVGRAAQGLIFLLTGAADSLIYVAELALTNIANLARGAISAVRWAVEQLTKIPGSIGDSFDGAAAGLRELELGAQDVMATLDLASADHAKSMAENFRSAWQSFKTPELYAGGGGPPPPGGDGDSTGEGDKKLEALRRQQEELYNQRAMANMTELEQLRTHKEQELAIFEAGDKRKAEVSKYWDKQILANQKATSAARLGAYKSMADTMGQMLGIGIKEQAMIMIPFELAEAKKEFAEFLGTKDPSALAASVEHVAAAAAYAKAAAAGGGGAGSSGGGGGGGSAPKPREEEPREERGRQVANIHFENVYGDIDRAWMQREMKAARRKVKFRDAR